MLGLGLALMIGLFSIEASACCLWINADDYTPDVGKKIGISLGWGHLFPSAGPMENEFLEEIHALDPTGKKLKISFIPESTRYQFDAPAKAPGTYLIVAKRKSGFFTYTTEGYKRQSKKGLKNATSCYYSEWNAKAVVNVGKGGKNEALSKEIGFTLEIVPLNDPGNLKEGDYLPVKVLFNGKPLEGFPYIYATYVGFSTESDIFAYTARIKKEGTAKIKILKPGIWMIKTENRFPSPDPEECDTYLYQATLTFEVR